MWFWETSHYTRQSILPHLLGLGPMIALANEILDDEKETETLKVLSWFGL